MSGPNEELFRGLLAYQGLAMSDQRVVDAVDGHRAIADGLQALRSVAMPYLEPVPEASSAIAWIESGAPS